MKTANWTARPILALTALISGAVAPQALAAPKANDSTIAVWVRGKDAPGTGRGARTQPQTVDLDTLPLETVEIYDAQYQQAKAYRGIFLRALLDRVAPAPGIDLAILHFANGMAIPLPFRDREVMSRLDPFVARGLRAEPNGPIVNGLFPRITKKEAKADGRADARPIAFSGNKVVVIERWHPAVPAKALGVFSPWTHADTLVGIELASAPAYYAQFDVPGGPDVRQGLEQFRQSCQFCHGARGVGAKHGWDFVEPTPMYSYRAKPRSLLFHVAYKPSDAPERGLMMPALRHMTEADAAVLWRWLKAVATEPMPAYSPK
jgi:mono/diheme cytochrome c family protein